MRPLRHGQRLSPGSPLGLLLLLLFLFLRALGLGRAAPRLLDHPAPVCAQQVRLGALPESGGRGCCQVGRGRPRAEGRGRGAAEWAGSLLGVSRVRGLGTTAGRPGEGSQERRELRCGPGGDGVFGERSRSAGCTTGAGVPAGGVATPLGPTLWGRTRRRGRPETRRAG